MHEPGHLAGFLEWWHAVAAAIGTAIGTAWMSIRRPGVAELNTAVAVLKANHEEVMRRLDAVEAGQTRILDTLDKLAARVSDLQGRK